MKPGQTATGAVVLVLLVCLSAHGQPEQGDIASEIRRIRKELLLVQEERSRLTEEKEKDRKAFNEYRKRTRKRMRQVRAETDSTEQLIEQHRLKDDSLAALVSAERARKRQIELVRDEFRMALIAGCDRASLVARTYPPMVSAKAVSATDLLRSELKTEAVDNIEGLNRLVQITQDMEEMAVGIQIVQGTSPVPEIRGTTFRIRIGTLLDAVVDAKGTRCAFWTGNSETGGPEWRLITDPLVASQVLRAVNVREGKALPTLVQLPFTHTTTEEPRAEGTPDEDEN